MFVSLKPFAKIKIAKRVCNRNAAPDNLGWQSACLVTDVEFGGAYLRLLLGLQLRVWWAVAHLEFTTQKSSSRKTPPIYPQNVWDISLFANLLFKIDLRVVVTRFRENKVKMNSRSGNMLNQEGQQMHGLRT